MKKSIRMSLELIIGPMFAGKSSAVLQRIRRAKVINRKVFIVTSILDTRYDVRGSSVYTHDKESVKANSLGVNNLDDIFKLGEFHHADMVIIEEAQFFIGLYEIVRGAVEVFRKDVIVVGLDGDSDRRPFGEILQLIPLADRVTRLSALCKKCGDGTEGIFTALNSEEEEAEKKEQIFVGGADKYMAVCRKHYLTNHRKSN